MKPPSERLYTRQGLSQRADAGGEKPLNICRHKGRIKREDPPGSFRRSQRTFAFRSDVRPVRFRVPQGFGPAPLGPRIDLSDWMTRTSTRGWPRPLGLCLHSPSGHRPPIPVQRPRRSPDPRFGGDGRRQGPRSAGSPSGRPSWDASAPRVRLTSPSGERRRTRDAGSWCVTDPHALRHGDLSPLPGFGRNAGSDHPAPVPRPTSVDQRTYAGAFGRGHGSGLGRSLRPRTGCPGHRRREDFGPPRHDGPCVRSPRALSTSVDPATGDHRPPRVHRAVA